MQELRGKRKCKIIYGVIDTNVIISSFLKSDSIPDLVVQLALSGPIIPLINDEILLEYSEVLLRDKFRFDKIEIKEFISDFIKRAIFLQRTKTTKVFKDPDDIVFYEIVLTARSSTNAYLITGNKKHFPKKSFVVTPKEMIEIIERNYKNK